MSTEPDEVRSHSRSHRWLFVTAAVVAAIAIIFYVGSFFIGHYLHAGH